MTTGGKRFKGTSGSTDQAEKRTKVSGVTKSNFSEKCIEHGGCVMIFREDQMFQTNRGLEKRLAKPRQWAAWRAYLHSLKISLKFFDSRKYFTAPAEWPHQFDADRDQSQDIAAGDWADVQAHREASRIPAGRLFDAERVADQIDRKAQAARIMAGAARIRAAMQPAEQPKKSLIDRDQLFAAHDQAMDEIAARRRAKSARDQAGLTAGRPRA